MPDDFSSLEHRLDDLDSWHKTEEAVKAAKAEEVANRRARLQYLFSSISAVSMLVNLYLTIFHRK